MIDLAKTRRENLQKIREKRFGTNAELARAVKRSSSQINDMLTGTKSFGSKLARQFEELLTLPTGYLDEPHELEKLPIGRGKKIPVLSFVQAGSPTSSGQNSYDEYIDVPETMPDGSYAVKIRGHSMEPEFQEGEIVVVDPTLSARPGDFVIARVANSYDNEATIKQYAVTGIDRNGVETFELRPLNPLFPTLSSEDLDIDLLGVVVEKRIRLR